MAKKKAKMPGKFGGDDWGYKMKRDYQSVLVVNIMYRGHVGRRVTQRGDYAFELGGGVDIQIDSYALNSDEIQLIEKKLGEDTVEESLKFSPDIASEALEALKDDLEYFLKDEKKEDEKKEKSSEISDPFTALFTGLRQLFSGVSLFKKRDTKGTDTKIETQNDLVPDNYIEKVVRAEAAETAAKSAYTVYDIYKKSHGMASSPEKFENYDSDQFNEPGVPLKSAFKKWENV